MLVDYDRVVLRLKHELQRKRSWGKRELTELITDLEVECTLDGDPPARELQAPETEGPLDEAAPQGPAAPMPERTNPLGAEGASNGKQDKHEEAHIG